MEIAKLAGAREARRFITELANLPELHRKDAREREAWARFAKMFKTWLKSLGPGPWKASQQDKTIDSPFAVGAVLHEAWLGNPYAGAAVMLSQSLRRAWSAPTGRERELAVLEAVADIAQALFARTGSRLALAGEPIGAAMLRGIHDADLMRVCLNPDCPARYFVAGRRSQKFCSEKCAEPARREYKRRWWNENRAGGQDGPRKRRR